MVGLLVDLLILNCISLGLLIKVGLHVHVWRMNVALDPGLETGYVVLIVIAVMAVIIGVPIIIVCLLRKRRRNKGTNN